MIMLHLQSDIEKDENATFHVYDVYNSLSFSHNKINDKENLSEVKAAMRMRKESIIMKDFNLHHSS